MVLGIVALLFVAALFVVIIDPFVHYHAPLSGLEYPLNDERYINDGIARHYEYEAIITGSSTSENFKTSQFEELFGVKTIKQTYPSGTYYEVSEGLNRAFKYNDEVKYVLWGLDLTRINNDPKEVSYTGIPEYMYDNNIFNDVSYLFNLDVMKKCVNVINYTKSGQKTTTMDDYGAWYPWATYGREVVLQGLIDYEGYTEEVLLTGEDEQRITENIAQNIIETAKNNPNVEFYIFYTPSSSAFWYGMMKTHQLNVQVDAEKLATSIMLEQENIHVFGFADKLEITTNLDNYMDTLHFSPAVSDEIISMISRGEGELTKDNYEEYYEYIRSAYQNYAYDYE